MLEYLDLMQWTAPATGILEGNTRGSERKIISLVRRMEELARIIRARRLAQGHRWQRVQSSASARRFLGWCNSRWDRRKAKPMR